MSRRVGRFFQVSEFDSRDGVTVPATAERELELLCKQLLDPLRKRFGRTTVLSGHRSLTHNVKVGGVAHSFHRYDLRPGRGVAADVRCARGTPEMWADFLDELGAGGLGRYDDFVHADTRNDGAGGLGRQARWRG